MSPNNTYSHVKKISIRNLIVIQGLQVNGNIMEMKEWRKMKKSKKGII